MNQKWVALRIEPRLSQAKGAAHASLIANKLVKLCEKPSAQGGVSVLEDQGGKPNGTGFSAHFHRAQGGHLLPKAVGLRRPSVDGDPVQDIIRKSHFKHSLRSVYGSRESRNLSKSRLLEHAPCTMLYVVSSPLRSAQPYSTVLQPVKIKKKWEPRTLLQCD